MFLALSLKFINLEKESICMKIIQKPQNPCSNSTYKKSYWRQGQTLDPYTDFFRRTRWRWQEQSLSFSQVHWKLKTLRAFWITGKLTVGVEGTSVPHSAFSLSFLSPWRERGRRAQIPHFICLIQPNPYRKKGWGFWKWEGMSKVHVGRTDWRKWVEELDGK